MKEIIPEPPAMVRNETAEVQSLFQRNVVPTYARFDVVLSHGSGSRVWDTAGRSYLDPAAASPSPRSAMLRRPSPTRSSSNRAGWSMFPISITTRRRAGWRRRS